MIVYVGGIPGVGKTTIIDEVEKRGVLEGLRIERAKVKEVLCELAGVLNVETYRTLSEKLRSSLHVGATKHIYGMDLADPMTVRLYDGHFCSLSPCENSEMIRPIQIHDINRLIAIIVLVAQCETIFARRRSDLKIRADRHLADVNFVKKEQRREIEVARAQAKILDIPLALINNDGEICQASESVLIFIENLIQPNSTAPAK